MICFGRGEREANFSTGRCAAVFPSLSLATPYMALPPPYSHHKAHCPYSSSLCSHMANPCRHSQHPFIQAHNVPQQGTIGTLFASIIDANGRERENERNHLTIRDIQLIMSHMCLQCQSNPMKFILPRLLY